MQHTPGPWYDHGKYVDALNPDDEDEGITIADDIRTPADAALIAAAPDLLAACSLAVEALESLRSDGVTGMEDDDAAAACSAAMKKAVMV